MFFHQSLQFCACLSALLISAFCQVLTSGNYSRLCADILFARSMGYYIIQVSSSWIKYVAKIHIEVERFCLVTSQVYVPSSLIVCMSWVKSFYLWNQYKTKNYCRICNLLAKKTCHQVSFYLDRGSAPARVGLGVTTVLTMVTLMGAVNRCIYWSYLYHHDLISFLCF